MPFSVRKAERLTGLRIERDVTAFRLRRWIAFNEDGTRYAAESDMYSDDSARRRLVGRVLALRRVEALERAGWRCEQCGAANILEVHHRTYRSHGGGHSGGNLSVLCTVCHQNEHKKKRGIKAL